MVKKRRPHKKPIGDLGPIHVTNVAGDPLVEWKKIALPVEKQEQELLIARAFCEVLNELELNWSIEPLTENDFDCLMKREGEERYLELQEIVIPGRKRGSPYVDREQVVYSAKFAETILTETRKKIAKYLPQTDLLLICYRILRIGVFN